MCNNDVGRASLGVSWNVVRIGYQHLQEAIPYAFVGLSFEAKIIITKNLELNHQIVRETWMYLHALKSTPSRNFLEKKNRASRLQCNLFVKLTLIHFKSRSPSHIHHMAADCIVYMYSIRYSIYIILNCYYIGDTFQGLDSPVVSHQRVYNLQLPSRSSSQLFWLLGQSWPEEQKFYHSSRNFAHNLASPFHCQ